MEDLIAVLSKNALVTALAVTGLMMFVSHLLSKYLTKGKLQSSAIAITLGLVVAYFAGVYTNGTKGISDIAIFSGFALLGGAMIRDLAIASTAFEVDVKEVKKAGKVGLIALTLGCVVPFAIGVVVAWCLGYKDPISMTTIGAGAMTYIGNGPNFMVKSIADSAGVKTPSFFGYIFKYSLPILLPILAVGGWLFL